MNISINKSIDRSIDHGHYESRQSSTGCFCSDGKIEQQKTSHTVRRTVRDACRHTGRFCGLWHSHAEQLGRLSTVYSATSLHVHSTRPFSWILVQFSLFRSWTKFTKLGHEGKKFLHWQMSINTVIQHMITTNMTRIYAITIKYNIFKWNQIKSCSF